jgi:L-fuconolactonase
MIDAYCHCGVSKYLPVEDVLAAMDHAAVERTVLVQHIGEHDNSYIAEVSESHPGRFAAVGLVDPTRSDWPDTLVRLNDSGHFAGLRVVTQVVREHPELPATACDLGLRLIVDAQTGLADAIAPVRALAAAHPAARMVFSHLGFPALDGGRLSAGREILELADSPGVHVQLSGLSMVCPYPYAALEDFVREVIAAFAPERVMWGSNFPVCGDAAAFKRDLELVRSGAHGLDAAGVEQILESTAARFWFGS